MKGRNREIALFIYLSLRKCSKERGACCGVGENCFTSRSHNGLQPHTRLACVSRDHHHIFLYVLWHPPNTSNRATKQDHVWMEWGWRIRGFNSTRMAIGTAVAPPKPERKKRSGVKRQQEKEATEEEWGTAFIPGITSKNWQNKPPTSTIGKWMKECSSPHP